MKLRPLLVLLLFVASAAILVWIYRTTTHDQPTAKDSPWTDILADLDACSRRKHVKAAQYDHFAHVSGDEGRPGAANLFRAMAFSERLGELNCANAIIRLGGSYHPPMKVVVFHSTTADNLDRSIAYEERALAQMGGHDIRRAFEQGNRYAARVLIWASADDLRHIALMKAYRDHNTPREQASASGYLVCKTCGNLYSVDQHDLYCPFCLADHQTFVEFR